MPVFKIIWNSGYGDSIEFVECADKDEADQLAYEQWRDEAESHAQYYSEGPLEDPTKDPDHPDHDPEADE